MNDDLTFPLNPFPFPFFGPFPARNMNRHPWNSAQILRIIAASASK